MAKRNGDSRSAFWKDETSISFVYCDMCQQNNTSLTGTVQSQLVLVTGQPAGQVMVLISWAGTAGDDSTYGLCQLFLLERTHCRNNSRQTDGSSGCSLRGERNNNSEINKTPSQPKTTTPKFGGDVPSRSVSVPALPQRVKAHKQAFLLGCPHYHSLRHCGVQIQDNILLARRVWSRAAAPAHMEPHGGSKCLGMGSASPGQLWDAIVQGQPPPWPSRLWLLIIFSSREHHLSRFFISLEKDPWLLYLIFKFQAL